MWTKLVRQVVQAAMVVLIVAACARAVFTAETIASVMIRLFCAPLPPRWVWVAEMM